MKKEESTMKNYEKSQRSPYETSPEFHALVQARSKVALQGVEEMSKHPYSLEQAKEQIKAMKKQQANGSKKQP